MLDRPDAAGTTRLAAEPPLLRFIDAQTHERELLDTVATRGRGCLWSVWRTERALIAPRLSTHAPGFERAARKMSARGWPVFIRDTGGDITPQSPGVVNVTSAFVIPRTDETSIRATYEQFCAPLLTFLSGLGFDAYLASVERSFCDGAFNIAIEGKKLAGTAQKWRLVRTADGEPGIAVLAHAAILADADIAESISETNLFYRLCGVDRTIDPARHVSTAEHSGASLAAKPLAVKLSRFLGG